MRNQKKMQIDLTKLEPIDFLTPEEQHLHEALSSGQF